ncbi:MAG: 50S ribosomal protein L6 [Acidilobaceae archaeon]
MAREVHVSREVEIPEGVSVEVEGLRVKVKGPKGEILKDFSHARGVNIRVEGNRVIIESFFPRARQIALVGSLASHIRNMIVGVTRGFRYKLKIIYVHYPISVKVEKGRVVISNFLGEKSLRAVEVPSGVRVTVSGQDVIVEGIDIESVSQTAARIEEVTRVRDKDRRKFMDGIYIYAREVA